MQLRNDVGRGVALDRIGQEPVEALAEHLGGLVQLTFGEQEDSGNPELRRRSAQRCSGKRGSARLPLAMCLSGLGMREGSAAYRAACPPPQMIISADLA